LTERFSEKIEQEGTPLVYADSSFYHIIRPLSATSTVFIPKDGQFDAAFKSVLDEMDRFAKFGITADELERQKQNLLTDARLAWQNRDKTESKALIESLIGQVLYDTPLMSPDAEYELAKKTIDGITLGEIKKTVKTYFGSRGKALVVTAPENVLPEQSDIEAIWKNYKSPVPLKPPAAASGERPFFEPPAGFSRGSITAEKKLVLGDVSAQSDAPTVTELALSNGATVIVCPTEFNADTFLFTAITRGGLSLLTDEESLSAARAADYLELSGLNGFPQADITKMLAGKQLSIYPHITQTTASLTGSAATTDIETYFQFIYLYFTAPYFTQSAWERLLSNELIEIQGRKNNPRDVFFNELIAYIYNNSLRYANLTEETLKLLDANRAEQLYRRYFGDAGKFTFIFTGDIDIDEVKQLSETYIAQIPSDPVARSDEARITANPFPAGKKNLTVKKGLEEQAEVCIIAGGENHEQIDPPQIEAEMVSLAGQLAETRLTEALRLRLGSVYGIGVDLSVANYPARRYFAEIIFNCEPSRVNELIAVVNDELQKLRAAPPTAEEITMLKETFARKRETAVKTNNFWHSGFARNIGTRQDAALFARDAEILARITPQNIQRYMRIYLGLDNAVTGILLPEQSR
jgi:zinc protease